jgi:hypothetical protein
VDDSEFLLFVPVGHGARLTFGHTRLLAPLTAVWVLGALPFLIGSARPSPFECAAFLLGALVPPVLGREHHQAPKAGT